MFFLISDHQRNESKPIRIHSAANGNNNSKEGSANSKQSLSSFEDVKVDDSDENYNSPPVRKEHMLKSKFSNSINSSQNKNSSYIPRQHNLDEQMLLDSMIDNDIDDHGTNRQTIQNNNRLPHKSSSASDSNGVFLLLDANEHLTVSEHMISKREKKTSIDKIFRLIMNLNLLNN